jgi:hypothetical protein
LGSIPASALNLYTPPFAVAFFFAESRCSHWVVRKISFVVVRGYSPPAEGLQGLREGFDTKTQKAKPLETTQSLVRQGFEGFVGLKN